MESNKISARNLALRILRSGAKAFLVYIAYFIFTLITRPIYRFIGKYSQLIDIFFIAIIFFAFIIEFFSKTIVKYMLEFSRSLFIISYFIVALNGGIVEAKVQNIGITVNLQFFLLMLILINIIGIARTVLAAINFLNEKSEREL